MRIHYGSIPTVLKKEHTCSLEPICSHHYARCAWGPSHLNSYILAEKHAKRKEKGKEVEGAYRSKTIEPVREEGGEEGTLQSTTGTSPAT